jgi:hypothetical protein
MYCVRQIPSMKPVTETVPVKNSDLEFRAGGSLSDCCHVAAAAEGNGLLVMI